MRLPSIFEWLFIVLIAATALLKLFVLRSEPPLGDELLVARLKRTIEHSGLAASVHRDPPLSTIVSAQAGNCRLWARDFQPYGNSLGYFRQQAADVGPLTFVYNSERHREPPKIEPLIKFYIAREIARAGLRASRRPIIAVAATSACKLDAIDWDQVRKVPW